MRKIILITGLIAVMLSAALLAGCDRVPIGGIDDNAFSKTFDYTDFTGIEVGDAFQVDIAYADTYSITVTASESVMKRVNVSQTGDTLKIDVDEWWWFWRGSPRATITLPALHRLVISGASDANVRGFKSGEDFDLVISGTSEADIDMEIGRLDAEISGASDLTGYLKAAASRIEVSGASEVKLMGSGGDLTLTGSGASSVKLSGYAINDADIDFSGASHGDIDVSGKLDVTLSGASSLEYTGNPELGRVNLSGTSRLEEVH